MEVNNAVKSQISVDANGAKLAFDRFHNSGPDSYHPSYKIQNDFSEDNGRLSDSFTSDFFFHEQPSLHYSSWATQEDPYQLMDCAKGTPKNRNLIDGNNYGSEADLYGLVSTILDDGDSVDSYFSQDRISTGLRAMWSPSSMKENNLQYLNSEVKMLSSSGMQLNPEPGSKPHIHSTARDSNQNTEIYQDFNSFETVDPSWLLSVCNGESETYTQTVPDLTRPPPGLDIPPAVSSQFSKLRPSKSKPGLSGKDRSFCSTNDAFSEYLNDRPKMEKIRQFSMQDANKLANTMQAFLMSDQEDIYNRESAQSSLMSVKEEKVVDLKSVPFQKMSAFASHVPSLKRDIAGSLREQRGCEFPNKNQSLQSNYITNEFSGFGQQAADYLQLSKSLSPPFNVMTPHQGKDSSQRETKNPQTSLPQYNLGQSNIYQSQTKLPAKSSINNDPEGVSKLMSQSVAEFVPVLSSEQMQRTGPRVHAEFGQGNGMSLQGRMGHTGMTLGLDGLRKVQGPGGGEDFDLQLEMSRLSTASSPGFIPDPHSSQWFGVKPKLLAGFPKEADKKTGLLQNSYQVLGNMYACQTRHNGANSNQAKPVSSPMFRCLYQMGVSGQNSCHLFPSRSSQSYGGSVPVMNMSEPLPDGDFPALNPYLQDLIGPSTVGGDGPFSGSNLRSPKVSKSRGAPTSQLHYYLEECYEQWRMLEKERKKTEAVLMKSYPGKRLSVMSSNSLPKMPPNPSRVDRLIVDQLREQAKVVSLLGKMERLRSFPLHANICSALDRHLEAIYITQARRKEEFLNSSRQRQGSGYLREDREILLLACALKDLCSNTRKSRTALWCALQMTLPKTNTSVEDAGDTPPALRCHSPDQVVPERVPPM